LEGGSERRSTFPAEAWKHFSPSIRR
jgi:hypothetical protein